MSAVKTIAYLLSVLGILLQLAVAGLVWKRKLHKEYYFFFCYLLFDALSSALLVVLSYGMPRSPVYFYSYWVQGALLQIFAFAVFNELFCAAFKPFAGLRDMAQVVFRWAAVALLLIGAVVFCSSSLPNAQRVSLMLVNLERSICVMQCGLLLFLFMGSSYLGLSKRSHVFGLSLGFGLMAALNLIFLTTTSVLGYYNRQVHAVFNLLIPVLWLSVQCIWMSYIANPEPARETVNVPVTSPLLRWNEVAMALGHSGGRVAFVENPEPFMPNVERMVEEIMKRDMVP